MLKKLYVKNFALIDELEMDLDRGLNILTGETGAGKSIIMGALGLILGNRLDGKSTPSQGKKTVVEGHFSVDSYQLASFYESYDLDYEAETIIRREISPEGKSRAFVNDSPVTLQTLKLLAERLIDIHSQHATLQMSTEAFQLLVVDSIAANESERRRYKEQLQKYKEVAAELEALQSSSAQASAEFDYHQFVFQELEQAALQEGEVAQLEAEQQQLENAEEIKRGLSAAHYLLDESEQNVIAALREAMQELQKVEGYVPQVGELLQRIESSWIDLKDVDAEITSFEEGTVVDEERLQVVSERLSSVYHLIQKYRVADTAELIKYRDELEQKILAVSNQDERLSALEKAREKAKEQALLAGQKLSKSRHAVVKTIVAAVESTLSNVGMPNAKLTIDLLTENKFKSSGIDRIQFLFAANKGQSPQPIEKVASGGELSRVMLAIKSLVAKSSSLPTIVFDEIDTGISGEVALKVGEVMEEMSSDMQVIAITHLPQIASKGQRHFKVYKEDQKDRTVSHMEILGEEERVVEIAKMLSGDQPGEAALTHAKVLLGTT